MDISPPINGKECRVNARKQSASQWINESILAITTCINKRIKEYLPKIITAMILAVSQPTITGWLRRFPGGIPKSTLYYQVASIGRKVTEFEDAVAEFIGTYKDLLSDASSLTFIIDDTPTKRYGPKIEGANYHHNPTPSKTDARLCYGHSWVVLAIVLPHPTRGAIVIPLRHLLYIRENDVKKLTPKHQKEHPFRTKLAMATELIHWAYEQFSPLNKGMTLLIDGGYASNDVIAAAQKVKMKVITRLRKDSAIFTVPEESGKKRRGRPKKYGDRINLSEWVKEDSWIKTECDLYGKKITAEYKTAVVTSRLTDGTPFRAVMTRRSSTTGEKPEPSVLFFSSNVHDSPKQIIETYSLRFGIEEMFKDLKENEGIGKQQARKLESNIGAFSLCLLMYALIEIWAWDQPDKMLTEYSRSSWDDPNRRPSHADKRNALRLVIKRDEFRRVFWKKLNPYLFRRIENSLFFNAV